MKIQPILLSPSLVDATLKGFKTQTRRTHGLDKFNQNPDRFRYDGVSNYSDQPQDYTHYFELLDIESKPTEQYTSVKAKMKPGDVFWVRETFGIILSTDEYCYKADLVDSDLSKPFFGWKPSIHMPKKACRLFLKVNSVRIERLHDLSENDAISEGISKHRFCPGYHHYTNPENFIPFSDKNAAKISFGSLWISINGEESWDLNPWVWVYEFEQCDEPEKFKI